MTNAAIAIPQHEQDVWAGTTGVACPCGGRIDSAEAGYVPGARACRTCLTLYTVRGSGATRRLVPQAMHAGIIEDAAPGDDLYRVSADLI